MSKDPQEYLPYINLEEGLGRIRNNKKLYAKMLNSFMSNTAFEDLRSALAKADLPNIQYHAHTLKGVAANLSFKLLYNSAAEFELSVKELNQSGQTGELPAKLESKFSELELIYQKTIELIKALKAEYEAGEGL